jgi:tetratricopeptide (TPR) repeat protein
MKKIAELVLVTCSLLIWSEARGDLLGAKAVLAQAAAGNDAPADRNSPPQLRVELAALVGESDASKWADRWLALLDRVVTEPSFVRSDDPLEFSDFVKAMPPPAGWQALRAASSTPKDADTSLRLERTQMTWWTDRLLGDEKGLLTDFRGLTAMYRELSAREPERFDSRFLDSLADSTIALMTDRAEIAALLNERLAAATATAKARNQSDGYGGRADFRVPDVVMLLGRPEAEKWMTEALTSYPGTLMISGSSATFELAVELATRLTDRLAAPQWALTCSLDGGPLFDAMQKKFGGSGRESNFREAQSFAFFRALLADDHAAISAILKASANERGPGGQLFQPSALIEELTDSNRAIPVSKGLHRILTEDPTANLWSSYIRIAVLADDSEEMLHLLDATLANPALPADVRRELEEERISADLAADKADAAARLLARGLAASKARRDDVSAAVQLARLGLLLDRPAWVSEGVAGANAAFERQVAAPNQLYRVMSSADDISGILLDAGHPGEAEKIWVQALAAYERARKDPDESSYLDGDESRPALLALTGIYTAAGRSADVLELVERAPSWGARDLVTIYAEKCALGNRQTKPLGVCVAWALAKEGRKEESVALLKSMLPWLSGNDSAYELLAELLGAEAIPELDRLAKLDAFEERPLIWKAKLLLDAGRLDEAETTARAAIKIDPSDGEEGPGDRMRVYAVLADILSAKGDPKQADFLRGVVKSIRLSEKADTFYEAGLLKRAIALYEESLNFFADAYCIQSRLALRLAEAGDWPAAEEHYRRAYELMPASFGRVESHCFGCERAFAGRKQQTLAERVFTKLANEQAKNPQVHYLLGYLHDEQGRTLDAVKEFQKAVELDPDYLNAWKKLADAPAAALSPKEHTRVAGNLIRLDPFGRHSSPDLSGVDELAEIWQLLAAVAESAPHLPASLFPLPASAAALAAAPPSRYPRYRRDDDGEDRSPGAVFADQRFTEAAGSWMQILASRDLD